MNKKLIVLLVVVSILFVITINMVAEIDYKYEKSLLKIYHDSSLYLNDTYGEIIENEHTCAMIKNYFPDNESFPYRNYISDFTIFDGLGTSIYDFSVTMELKFNSSDVYNEFKRYEYNRFSYTEVLLYNDYSINLVNDDTINRYYYKQKKPYEYGLLCFNDNSYIIRYIYYYYRGPNGGHYEEIFTNVDLTW